jgi:hypothetical protein
MFFSFILSGDFCLEKICLYSVYLVYLYCGEGRDWRFCSIGVFIHCIAVLLTLHTFLTSKKYAKNRWGAVKRAIIVIALYHYFSRSLCPKPRIAFILLYTLKAVGAESVFKIIFLFNSKTLIPNRK